MNLSFKSFLQREKTEMYQEKKKRKEKEAIEHHPTGCQ